MKIKISELKANPFKKFINNGELNEERLDVLKESIEHGTLPEHFMARKNDGIFELTSGHHRVEALRQMKGDEYVVDVTPVTFSDEQMLIDMVRENITQRDTDVHDTAESIYLARSWLQSGCNRVNQFNTVVAQQRKKNGTFESSPDSYRSIAEFISKNGKTISYVTVKNHLDMKDKLAPDLYKKVKKVGGGKATEDVVTVKQAIQLSKIDDKEEQHDVLEAMRREETGRPHELITKYKEAPENIKKKVRSGEIRLRDVESETIMQEIEEQNEKSPPSIFIPNLSTQMSRFDSCIAKLSLRGKILFEFFNSEDFLTKYETLDKEQQKNIVLGISKLKNDVKKCYDRLDAVENNLKKKKMIKGVE